MPSYTEIFESIPTKLYDQNKDFRLTGLVEIGSELYKKFPGFFTPFRTNSGITRAEDFGLTLVAPVCIPLILGTLTILATALVTVAAIVAIGSLMFAAVASLGNSEFHENALLGTLIAGAIACASVPAALLLAIVTLVSIPFTGLNLLMRSASTLTNLTCGIPAVEDSQENSQEYSYL